MKKSKVFNAVLASVTGLLFTLPSARGVALVQWPVASGGNGAFYGWTDMPSDWNTAEATAVALGGHLTSITSAAEQAWLNATFLSGPALYRTVYWIGLCDLAPYGGGSGSMIYTTWTTGEPVTYTNWETSGPNGSEPNNFIYNTSGEDYGTMNWHYSYGTTPNLGSWNDVSVNGVTFVSGPPRGPYFGLVKIAPEPSSAMLMIAGALLLFRRRRLTL